MLSDAPIAPALPAVDIERAKAYYREKLGFEPVEDDGGELVYESGGRTTFTVYPSAFAGTNQATAAGWYVDDIAATVADLRSRGVVFEEYDLPGLKTMDGIAEAPSGNLGAWFKDSEGNTLGIVQRSD